MMRSIEGRTLTLAIACLMFLLACVSPAHATLIAHWEAENNGLDSSGNNHTASAQNGAGYDTGVVGSWAFSLDGSNDYYTAEDHPHWWFDTNPFTIALWANFGSIDSGSNVWWPNTFLSTYSDSGGIRWWAFNFTGGTVMKPTFQWQQYNNSKFVLQPASGFDPGTNAWHHFAVTRSGSTFTFFADGNSLGTVTESAWIGDQLFPLVLGMTAQQVPSYFDGLLDDVRIYNHALSETEIRSLPAVVPEPYTALLLAGGLAGLAAARRRRSLH